MLDEPTTAIDDTTITSLLQRLEKYLVNKTLILVTHKASLLKLTNKLIVIDSGNIATMGPTEEVLKALSEGKIRVKSG